MAGISTRGSEACGAELPLGATNKKPVRAYALTGNLQPESAEVIAAAAQPLQLSCDAAAEAVPCHPWATWSGSA